MHPWDWFETKVYGHPLRKRSRRERLKWLLISAASGLALGLLLVTSGLGQSFLATGLKQAGYDPRPLYNTSVAQPLATSTPVSYNAAPATPAPVYGGGWVTPLAP